MNPRGLEKEKEALVATETRPVFAVKWVPPPPKKVCVSNSSYCGSLC